MRRSIDSDIGLVGAGFWRSFVIPSAARPAPTFEERAIAYLDDAERYHTQADDVTLSPYERGRARFRAALARTKADECLRVALAERVFP